MVVSDTEHGSYKGAYLISKYFTLLVSLPINIGAIENGGTVLHQATDHAIQDVEKLARTPCQAKRPVDARGTS